MADDMSSIPPRVGALEMEAHTVRHRLSVLEETHKEIPHRMTKVEIAVERLPAIDRRLEQLEDQVARGFNKVLGAVAGAGFIFGLIEIGPKLLKLLGGN
ncbi:hypothetical protein KLEP174_gp30 [Pseudomonas phage vB_PcuM_ KLEP17-4]|nr:hypothetical protein KLEP174_gp30 [Pseudomonas phage vB_PcuM_ KLEP17-4]